MTTTDKVDKRVNKDFLEEICFDNIEYLLDKLDIANYDNKYTYYTMPCPIHAGGNTTGFSISLNRRVWKCWSSHEECSEQHSKDIFGLIMAVKKLNFAKSIQWVCEIFNIDGNEVPTIDSDEYHVRKLCKKAKKKSGSNKKTYPKDCLDRLKDHEYFLNRNYTKETLDDFQCGFVESGGYMANRIVFPVLDLSENIVGFTGRTIYDECDKCGKFHMKEDSCDTRRKTESKWIKSKKFPTDSVIYNLYRARFPALEKSELIIVEGIPDVMRLYQIGVHNVVCLLHASISQRNISQLVSIGYIRKLWLFGDSDHAGKNFKNRHSRGYNDDNEEDFGSLARYFSVERVDIPNHKDIGDATDDFAIEFCKNIGIMK